MFVLNNAWKTVIRNKGRNILIMLIVAIIAAAATIGLAIRNAAENARETGLANTSVTATISVDRSKLMEQARESQSSDSSSGSSDSSDSSDSDSAPDFDAMRGALDSSNLTLADYQKYAKASSVSVFVVLLGKHRRLWHRLLPTGGDQHRERGELFGFIV